MNKRENILVAIDENLAATEAVRYVGRIVSGKRRMAICLLHMFPPFPPQLLEFRGAEDPDREQELDQEMDARSQQWIREAEPAVQAVLDKAALILKRAGVPSDSIKRIVRELVNHEELSQDILETARENKCQTVVVGRSSFPWLRELFHHHIADDLVKRAKGMTVWVVEQEARRPRTRESQGPSHKADQNKADARVLFAASGTRYSGHTGSVHRDRGK